MDEREPGPRRSLPLSPRRLRCLPGDEGRHDRDRLLTGRVSLLAYVERERSSSAHPSGALPASGPRRVPTGGSVTVGGQGLPRLQELAYVETIATAAAAGLSFEKIRLALVDHIWGVRQA